MIKFIDGQRDSFIQFLKLYLFNPDVSINFLFHVSSQIFTSIVTVSKTIHLHLARYQPR